MYGKGRKSNGRYRDLMAQTALIRLWRGEYRGFNTLAADCDVAEITVRDWFTWWRTTWGVHIDRESSDGTLVVANWGAIDPNRLEAWIKSGRAADGALLNGVALPLNYVPWTTREWPKARVPGERPVFVYREEMPPPDGELREEDLPL